MSAPEDDSSGEEYVLLPDEAAVHRVIHPDYNVVDEGRPSSSCLRPSKRDALKLSVDRADMRHPKESFDAFIAQGYKAFAVITVGAEHCRAVELPRRHWPVPGNSSHSFIDYRNLTNGQVENKSKKLYNAWKSAGSTWSYVSVSEESVEMPVPKNGSIVGSSNGQPLVVQSSPGADLPNPH